MAEQNQPKFKRVLLKLSGEALAKDVDGIYNHGFIDEIAATIKRCVDAGVEIGVVVGAGNIWRGRQGVNMDRVRADHMGMLATVINSLALQDAFERAGITTRVMTAIEMNPLLLMAKLLSVKSGKRLDSIHHVIGKLCAGAAGASAGKDYLSLGQAADIECPFEKCGLFDLTDMVKQH